MTERNKGNKRISYPGRIAAGLICVLLCASAWVLGILLKPEGTVNRQEKTSVARLQAGDFTDLDLLEESFGAQLPVWENVSCKGMSRNGEYDGQTVRRADAEYANGVRVSAVMPKEAAPLIRDERAALLLNTDFTVQGLPCALSAGGDNFAAYFTKDNTAYAIYMEDTDEESFISLLSAMQLY